ncbi:hypothetical protein B9Z65_533 [Elsinoe australis]|uniref:Mus7/MMS22 family protein n=1 Tax=Elsinoe australis TaxID=40998 RepID=A0A2P8AIS7_9PEZI|nr:hypothetical protein B9Z65_533 [Elsinoe australis]
MQDWREKGYVADSDEDETPISTAVTDGGATQDYQKSFSKREHEEHFASSQNELDDKENEPVWAQSGKRPGHSYGREIAVTPRATTYSQKDHRYGRAVEAKDTTVQDVPNDQDSGVGDPRHSQRSGSDLPGLPELSGSTVQAPVQADIPSAASSPLSDAQSEIAMGSPPPFRLPMNLFQDMEVPAAITVPTSISPNLDLAMAAPMRSFRNRKAIQLHPYLIEGEKYRQTMRAGGYKPVHMAASQELGSTQPVPKPRVERYEGSSEPSMSQDSYSAPSETQDLVQPQEKHANNAARYLQLPDDEEADLPDLDTLMRMARPGRLPKRRKLFHIPVVERAPEPSEEDNGQEANTGVDPPTPPTSQSGGSSVTRTLKAKKTGFQLPRAILRERPDPHAPSPSQHRSHLTQPTTPIHATAPTPISIDDNEDQAERQLANNTDEDDSSNKSSSDSEVQFYSARKRIRGVLPASWLRIDNKAVNARAEVRRTALQARTDSAIQTSGKGIAQRRLATSASPEKRINRFEDFSSSSENERPAETPLRSNVASALQPHEDASMANVEYDSDQMEDNAVDAMFPTGSRNRQSSDKGKKRQTKIANGFTQPKALKERSISSTGVPGQRSTTNKNRKSRSGLKQPPLSIIDLDPPSPGNQAETPPFLRLAKRQARGRDDRGRHSPSQKAIRLATRADTEDAISTLTAWQTGKIPQRPARAQAPHRQPSSNTKTRTRSLQHLMSLARERHSHEHRSLTSAQTSLDSHTRSSDQLIENNAADPARSNAEAQTPESEPRPRRVPLARRGQMQTTARHRNQYRSAQLESDATGLHSLDLAGNGSGLHNYDLVNMLRKQPRLPSEPNFQLQRFLGDTESASRDDTAPVTAEDPTETREVGAAKPFHVTRKRQKKPVPARVPVEVADFRQPALPPPVVTIKDEQLISVSQPYSGLQGLEAHDGRFPTDFDVRHLHLGTYFHSSTFLGSGDFAKALASKHRDLAEPAGHIVIRIDDVDTYWSEWNDDSAIWLNSIKDVCKEAVQFMTSIGSDDDLAMLAGPYDTMTYLLRSLVRYISSCLCCREQLKQTAFRNAMRCFIEDVADMLTLKPNGPALPPAVDQHLADCLTYLMTLAAQVYAMGSQDPTLMSSSTDMAVVLRQSCYAGFASLFKTGCRKVYTFLDRQQHHSVRDAGIKEEEVAVKFIVMTHHIMHELALSQLSFEALTTQLWKSRIRNNVDVKRLDMVWYDLMSFQPLLELDPNGIYRPGTLRSEKYNHSCWSAAKLLLDQTFEAYTHYTGSEHRKANDYLRSLFTRIGIFISKWRWRGSEPALASIYDFFAKRSLANLSGERSSSSPAFLRHLDEYQTLEIEYVDLAYHAFLKVLATGLKAVSKEYPANKLKRVAWRFIPNHGRTYRKDQEVRQADLDALRNHHDLLCTLFWALPSGSRPRLDHIKDLVDFTTSHLEACRINIDAWRNLAVYIMSHTDQQAEIPALADWFRDIADILISQYRLARSEAEELFEMSKERQSGAISYDVMQMTVTSNQRRILSTLQDLIQSLQNALTVCNVRSRELELIDRSNLVGLCRVFDATQSRTFGPVQQILGVVKKLLTPDESMHPSRQSDESQDYGDWTGMDDLLAEQPSSPDKSSDLISVVQPAISQLLSNCFGAESPMDDSLLTSLTEVWCKVASLTVDRGLRSWSDYLDLHGSFSWYQLRHTEHFYKYTPLVLAQILSLDPTSFNDHSTLIISQWVISLVTPETQLKHQHTLTSALLNTQPSHPLLYNLPFARTSSTTYIITLSDLTTRRTSLLPSLLSNIRTTLACAPPSTLPNLRREYTLILRSLQTAMKESYLSLSSLISTNPPSTISTSATPASASLVSKHTTFLHSLISLHQQHTPDLLPLDPFFTDPRSFPPPDHDPKYLVARLKGYVPKLSEEKGRKQLVVFLMTVLAQGVSQGRTPAIAAQVELALRPGVDDGTRSAGGLRSVVVRDILPAYLRIARERGEAVPLVVPLVRALGRVLGGLGGGVDLWDGEVARREMGVVERFLREVVGCGLLGLDSGISVMRLWFVREAFEACRCLVGVVDFVDRATGEGDEAVRLLMEMERLGRYWLRDDGNDVAGDGIAIVRAERLTDVGEYARQSMSEELNRSWSLDGRGRVLHGRGERKVEVTIPGLGTREEEMQKVRVAAEVFCREYSAIFKEHKEHSDGVDEGLAGLCI